MKQRKKSFGMRISAFVLSFAMVCTLLAGVNVVAFAADDELTDTVAVQKFYNDAEKGGTGEHIYTIDESEISWYQSLPSWNDEGDAWLSPLMSSTPVYRVFNPNSGEHLWITDKGYVDLLVGQGWNQEQGVAFYSDDNKGVPVYRLWDGTDNLRSHHYTTDEGEIAWLVTLGWTVEDVAFYGVKEEEPGEKEMTALQTGASEITVVSESEFAGTEEFTVTTALGEEAAEFVFLDENTVVITLESPIVETEYTVTCSDIEYEPASFVGEEAEVTNLIFVDDQLVLSADGKEATVGYATVDQFGDPIDDTVEFKAGAYQAEGVALEGQGILTIANSNSAIVVGTQIPVAAIYAGGTKVVNETFTVAATSVVADMQVMDLMVNPYLDEDTQEALAGKRITAQKLTFDDSELTNYVVPVKAKDQYGNELTAGQLNGMLDQTLYVQPSVVAADKDKAGIISVVNEGGVVFLPGENGVVFASVVGNGTASGVGALSFLSIGGFTTTKNVKIEQNEMVDTINVAVGDLVAGQPSPVAITAINQYGEPIDFEEEGNSIVVNADGEIELTYGDDNESTIELSETGSFQDGANFDMPGVFFALSYSQSGAEFMTISPTSKKVSVKQLTVKPAAVPTTIQGISPLVNTVIGGTDTKIEVDEVGTFIFKDQYNSVIDPTNPFTLYYPSYRASTAAAGDEFFYTVTAPTAAKTYTKFNAVAGTIEENDDAATKLDGPGSDKYTVTLYSKDEGVVTKLNQKTFTATVAGDAVSYNAVADPTSGALYVGKNSTDKTTIVVYGTDSKGNTFTVNPDNYTLTVDSGLAVTGSSIAVSGTGYDIEDGLKEGEANVKVYVKGKVEASTTVSYSNANPEAMLVMVYEATDVDDQTTYKLSTVSEIIGDDDLRFEAAVINGNVGLKIRHTTGTDANSGYVIMALDQYMQAIANTEVTLLDSWGDDVDNNTAQINNTVFVGDVDDFITAVVENDDVELTFTVSGVTLNDHLAP